MERVIAGVWPLFAGFLKECGKKLADWFWVQVPDTVNKWSKETYEYFKYYWVGTALLIGIFVVVKCFCRDWFWVQVPDTVIKWSKETYEYFMNYWVGTALLIGIFVVVKCFCRAKLACQQQNAGPNPGQTSTTEAKDEADCWDILILHADSDESNTMVYTYRDHLQTDLEVENVRVELIGDIGVGQSHFNVMANVLDRYRYIFIFLTPDFTEDTLTRFKMQMSLMESLQDPNKRERIIPIRTAKEKEKTQNDPRELEPLIGVHYWRFFDDQYKTMYIKSMQMLIEKGRNSFL